MSIGEQFTNVVSGVPSGGFERAWDYGVHGLKTAWDVVAFVGTGVADITTSQAGNPIMMAFAAMFAGMWMFKAAPSILGDTILPGDGMGSRLTRAGLSLVAVGLASLLAAGAVGALRDDPAPPSVGHAMQVSSVELPASSAAVPFNPDTFFPSQTKA